MIIIIIIIIIIITPQRPSTIQVRSYRSGYLGTRHVRYVNDQTTQYYLLREVCFEGERERESKCSMGSFHVKQGSIRET